MAITASTTVAQPCRLAAWRVTTSARLAASTATPSAAIARCKALRCFTAGLRSPPRRAAGSLCALDALDRAIEALLDRLPALRDVLQCGEHHGPEPRHLG